MVTAAQFKKALVLMRLSLVADRRPDLPTRLDRLYWRQEVNPVTFPMGVAWRHVADHVSYVSCGAGDQTWAVSARHAGALLRRQGVCEEDSAGAQWQHGLPVRDANRAARVCFASLLTTCMSNMSHIANSNTHIETQVRRRAQIRALLSFLSGLRLGSRDSAGLGKD